MNFSRNIVEVRAAGLPSERSDFLVTTLPRASIQPEKENLSDQTSAHCLISPSIFTRYGLTHIDFFKVHHLISYQINSYIMNIFAFTSTRAISNYKIRKQDFLNHKIRQNF